MKLLFIIEVSNKIESIEIDFICRVNVVCIHPHVDRDVGKESLEGNLFFLLEK